MASRAGSNCRFFPMTVRSARSRPQLPRAGIRLLVGDEKQKVALVTLLTSLGEAAKDTAIGSIVGRD
jgi:hypothetical protein